MNTAKVFSLSLILFMGCITAGNAQAEHETEPTIPATPAEPANPNGPGEPATPATPATPAQPGQHGHHHHHGDHMAGDDTSGDTTIVNNIDNSTTNNNTDNSTTSNYTDNSITNNYKNTNISLINTADVLTGELVSADIVNNIFSGLTDTSNSLLGNELAVNALDNSLLLLGDVVSLEIADGLLINVGGTVEGLANNILAGDLLADVNSTVEGLGNVGGNLVGTLTATVSDVTGNSIGLISVGDAVLDTDADVVSLNLL